MNKTFDYFLPLKPYTTPSDTTNASLHEKAFKSIPAQKPLASVYEVHEATGTYLPLLDVNQGQ